MSNTQLAGMTKDQLIAMLMDQAQSKVKFQVSDTGYIDVKGLPGHNWKGFGCTVQGWELFLENIESFKSFIAANKQLAAAKQQAWRSAKTVN